MFSNLAWTIFSDRGGILREKPACTELTNSQLSSSEHLPRNQKVRSKGNGLSAYALKFNYIIHGMLLPEKFLQFGWQRAAVFQLNFKHLHIKITVTTVTKIKKLYRHASYEKMAERFPDFEIQEIQELKENSENQNTKKRTSTWLNVWTSWAENKNFETNLLAFESKPLDENKQMALHDRISRVVV